MRKVGIGIENVGKGKVFTDELAIIKAAGFDGLDLNLSVPFIRALSHTPDAANAAKEIRSQIDDAGLEIFQAHAPFNPYNTRKPENAAAVRADLPASIDFAAEIGVPYLVCHPCRPMYTDDPLYPKRDELIAQNIEMYEGLCKQAEGTGVTICTENMFSRMADTERCTPGTVSFAHDLNEIMDAVPGLCVCLDFGHALVTGQQPADLVREFGKRLKITHLHNNDRKEDLHLSPFEMKTDVWEPFGKAIKEIGYEGAMTLEVVHFNEQVPVSLRPSMYRFLFDSISLVRDMAE